MILRKKIGWVFLFLISVLIGICTFLLNTSTGMYLICTGITYFIPGLTFDTVCGNWKNFNVKHIEYCTAVGIIKINRCDIILNCKHIFNGQICVENLFLEDVCIDVYAIRLIHKEVQPNKVIQISNVFTFLNSLIFKRIILLNTRIIANDFVLECKELENMGIIINKNNVLKILSTYVKEVCVNVCALNTVHATRIYHYSNFWDINVFTKELLNNLAIVLPTLKVFWNFLLEELQGQDLYIFSDNNQYKIDDFVLKLSFVDQISNLRLDMNSSYGCLHLISDIVLKENWPIDIVANCIIFDTKENHNSSDQNVKKINLTIKGDLVDEICLFCDFVNVISTVHMLLKIRATQCGIPINISIIGKKIPFSFLRKNRYLLEKINLCLSDEMRNYCIQMISQFSNSVQDLLMYIAIDVQGNFNQCIISTLRMESLNVCLEMKGMINWENVVRWNSVLTLHKVKISPVVFKYPIELSGVVVFQGYIYSDRSWVLKISNVNINGCDARKNRIFCTGSLCKDVTGQWIVSTLLIKWGSNILAIKGKLKKTCNVDIIVNAPQCDIVIPVLHGSIYGQCRIRGVIESPVLTININLHSLCWNEKKIFINRLILNSKINCNHNMLSDFFLKMDIARYDMLVLDQLIVKGKGNIEKHDININFCNNKIFFGEIKIFGNFDILRKVWNGKVYATDIITSVGLWKLSKNVVCKYQHAERKIFIDAHYWESVNCCIPIHKTYKINVLDQINTIVKNFNLISLNTNFLVEEINIHVARIYCTDCVWSLGEALPRGTILLSGIPLYVKFFNGMDTVSTVLNNINIKIVFNTSDISCRWYSDIINNNQIYGTFKINFMYDTPEISGSVYVNNFPLEFFSDIFVSSKKRCIQGLLNVNIRFCGLMHNPKIYGSIQLQNIRCNELNMPITIRNGKLVINFFEHYVILRGAIKTDYGKSLYIHGKLVNIHSINDMKTFLKLQGDQIDVCVSPYVQLQISPNVFCTINAKKICVQGTVGVPWARITMQDLSKRSVMNISPEEIILDDNFNPIILENYKNLSFFISSNITISLGNDVSFNGFGLNVKLKGNIVTGYNKNGLILTGHVDIPSGRCMIYGHYLTIKKGQLLFYGKLNQPYLDIEAIRNTSNTDEVIKGIRITGMLNHPKIEIFPNALLFSQQEVVSYLLGSNDVVSSYTDTNIITSLLIGVGMSHSEKFISKIGKIFGVQHLTLNAQNVSTNPLIVLSGFIAPGLQVKYGLGIFDLLSTITIRYCLHSKFYLEATSGNHQAIDLLYQFDF